MRSDDWTMICSRPLVSAFAALYRARAMAYLAVPSKVSPSLSLSLLLQWGFDISSKVRCGRARGGPLELEWHSAEPDHHQPKHSGTESCAAARAAAWTLHGIIQSGRPQAAQELMLFHRRL